MRVASASTAPIPRVPRSQLPEHDLSSHVHPLICAAEGECLGGSHVLSRRKVQHSDVLQLLDDALQSVVRAIYRLDVREKDDEAAVGGDEFLLHDESLAGRR